jgi:hypothetical protein
MVSVSDILKILDKAPIWKNLKELPARVDALEKRIAELEAEPVEASHLHKCAQCGKPAKVTEVKDDPDFGFAGIKRRTITCDDGHSIEYEWDPSAE